MRFSVPATALAVSLAALMSGGALSAATAVLAPPVAAVAAAPAAGAVQPVLAASRSRLKDGRYPGPPVRQYYGIVQAQANVRGGRLVSVDILRYPTDRRTSRWINARALPVLQAEVIHAQSARVSGISGATLTSEAFLMSVDGALRQAGG